MKNITTYLLNFSLISLTVVGVVFAADQFVKADEFHKQITMSNSGTLNEKWEMNVDSLYPGE